MAPSVPGSGWAARESRARIQSCDLPDESVALNANLLPSGETVRKDGGRIEKSFLWRADGEADRRRFCGGPAEIATDATSVAMPTATAATAQARRSRRRWATAVASTAAPVSSVGVTCASSSSSARRRCHVIVGSDPSVDTGGGGRALWVAFASAGRPTSARGPESRRLCLRSSFPERHLSGQHLIQHAPERPDVRPLVDGLSARLLRAHVGGCAQNRPFARAAYARRSATATHRDPATSPAPLSRARSRALHDAVGMTFTLAGLRSR